MYTLKRRAGRQPCYNIIIRARFLNVCVVVTRINVFSGKTLSTRKIYKLLNSVVVINYTYCNDMYECACCITCVNASIRYTVKDYALYRREITKKKKRTIQRTPRVYIFKHAQRTKTIIPYGCLYRNKFERKSFVHKEFPTSGYELYELREVRLFEIKYYSYANTSSAYNSFFFLNRTSKKLSAYSL